LHPPTGPVGSPHSATVGKTGIPLAVNLPITRKGTSKIGLARNAEGLDSSIGVFEPDGGSRRLFTYAEMDSIYTWQDALIFRNYLTLVWNQISVAVYQMACFDYKKTMKKY
jgi:hypothetical protein